MAVYFAMMYALLMIINAYAGVVVRVDVVLGFIYVLLFLGRIEKAISDKRRW